VPIVGFSSLMLAPALIRIHEKPQANWITGAKINTIRGEFMRQCDKLDGLVDGIINNYGACRDTFDVKQGKPNRHPWAAKRCPDNMDPNPADTSADACLTDGQISTLEFVYSRYSFSQPLANGVKTFGVWLPNTDPSGSGLIANTRFRGQEGAAENAPAYNWIGVLGVTGFLMQDLQGNVLDYVEGGKYSGRREALSEILDSSNPDHGALGEFVSIEFRDHQIRHQEIERALRACAESQTYPAPRAGQAPFFTVTSMGMPMTSIANLISSFVTTPL
jgi:feruloyl esterase